MTAAQEKTALNPAPGVRSGYQEREKEGLDNPVVHDTDLAIQVAVEGIRKLIKEDQKA